MKKYSFLLIFGLFDFYFCFSQKYQVLDSVTQRPISYVTIQTGKNKGFYSDENGKFALNENIEDSIRFSCIGYKNLSMAKMSISDVIYLSPKTQKLPEIIIRSEAPKQKIIGRKKGNHAWHINPKTQLATLIKPNQRYANSYIQKILIPISKYTLINKDSKPKKIKPDFNSVFKLQLFANENGLPGKALLPPIEVYCDEKSKNTLSVDISKYYIKLPKEGIFICVELIGEIGSNRNVKNSEISMPGFYFTDKQSNDFVLKSFYRSTFSDEWIKLDENGPTLNKEIFMSFQLVVLY